MEFCPHEFLDDELYAAAQASILSTEHVLPRTEFHDYDETVDLWTSEFLEDFNSCRPKSAAATSKPHVAFGRTTFQEAAKKESHVRRPRTAPNRCRKSLHMPTKLSDSRNQLTTEYLTKISGQQSKVRGTQMLNFKIDFSKAREKRKRQLQYSREIRSGAKSVHRREIDSVTRIVVQSFRKVIDCERCALFLMDESANELYFKPVGDSDHSHARLKEIRFPASSGVAGWVASNKMMLNIKNAYRDARFNADIDKKTGFRTRTILCHPVLSSSNQLLGVIQMVNKKKGDAKELRDRAKKKKSDNKNKGYQSCFEHFSLRDEEILGKCCSEVSKSLEEIFTQRDRRNKTEIKTDDQNKFAIVSDEDGISPFETSAGKHHCITREAKDDSSTESSEQAHETESMSYMPELPPRRGSTGRRSSVGQLAHFVRRSSMDENIDHDIKYSSLTEAIQKFQFRDSFRSQDPEKFEQKEAERRQGNPDFVLAQTKRKRMAEYVQKRS